MRLVEATRRSAVTLPDLEPMRASLLTTHMVEHPKKRRHTERFVTQEDIRIKSSSEMLRVRPDLVFALDVRGAQRLYFLEADRGTEGREQIEEKLTAYHHYAATDRWRRYTAAGDFRVLVVTTAEQRIASLWRAFAQHPAASKVAFSTMDEVKEQDVIGAPIWRMVTGKKECLVR